MHSMFEWRVSIKIDEIVLVQRMGLLLLFLLRLRMVDDGGSSTPFQRL